MRKNTWLDITILHIERRIFFHGFNQDIVSSPAYWQAEAELLPVIREATFFLSFMIYIAAIWQLARFASGSPHNSFNTPVIEKNPVVIFS